MEARAQQALIAIGVVFLGCVGVMQLHSANYGDTSAAHAVPTPQELDDRVDAMIQEIASKKLADRIEAMIQAGFDRVAANRQVVHTSKAKDACDETPIAFMPDADHQKNVNTALTNQCSIYVDNNDMRLINKNFQNMQIVYYDQMWQVVPHPCAASQTAARWLELEHGHDSDVVPLRDLLYEKVLGTAT